MFIISYFLFAMTSPCFCCWQSWLMADGWWLVAASTGAWNNKFEDGFALFFNISCPRWKTVPARAVQDSEKNSKLSKRTLEGWWVRRSCYRESWASWVLLKYDVVEFRFNCGSFWGEVAATPEGGRLPKEVADCFLESRCRHDIQVNKWGRGGNEREQTEYTSTFGN